jgi:antitoxin Phd
MLMSCTFDNVMDNRSKMANIANIMKTPPEPIDPILGELRVFDSSTVKNAFRDVAAQAAKGAVAISRYGRPELVIMPAGEYVHLEKLRRTPLDALSGQFDELVAKMQTANSKNAVQTLFGATSADLGKAALDVSRANAR